MSGIVIVGAGHAGAQVAAGLRDNGCDGPVALISREADLPYHKPPLSKSFMKTPDTPLQPLRAEVFYERHDIDLYLGRLVSSIDREGKRVVFDDGHALEYDKLVLATGTHPRQLPVPGSDLAGVHYLRTAEDARQLRDRLPEVDNVVVVGGGFIGLEGAAMLAQTGRQATVVEVAPRVLGRVCHPATADAVVDYLEGTGIHVLCETGVSAFNGHNGGVQSVSLDNGHEIAADLVIVGVGVHAEDQLASEAGLAVDNGIVVDDDFATSDADIFAVGDCVNFYQHHARKRGRQESVQNATDQARCVARILSGTPAKYTNVPWFWSDIGELKLQIAGLADDVDERICRHGPDGTLQAVYMFRDGALCAVETLNSPGEHMLARRMLTDGFSPPRALLSGEDIKALKNEFRSWRKRE